MVYGTDLKISEILFIYDFIYKSTGDLTERDARYPSKVYGI